MEESLGDFLHEILENLRKKLLEEFLQKLLEEFSGLSGGNPELFF